MLAERPLTRISLTCSNGHVFSSPAEAAEGKCPVCDEVVEAATLNTPKDEPPSDASVEMVTISVPAGGGAPVMVAEDGKRSFTVVQLHGLGGHGVVSLARDEV